MFGGLLALVTSEISSVVKRNATVLALYAAAAFLAVCAIGYALGALHAYLALAYGPVVASLSIAGGLLVIALITLGAALYIKNQPRPGPSPATAALAAAPVAARLMGPGKISWKAGLAAGVVVLGIIIGRQLGKGKD